MDGSENAPSENDEDTHTDPSKNRKKRKQSSSPAEKFEEEILSPPTKKSKSHVETKEDEATPPSPSSQKVERKLTKIIEDNEMLPESENITQADFAEDLEGEGKKHVRRRLKYLLQAVRDQMEFYFSDSNLSKDRFLKKFMDQNPEGYVDLAVFGNFNKLQTLNKDGVSLKILTKALARSKVLQLSKDKTKVKRTTPFKEISAEETDNRTVYVEYLPNHATHAWIQTIFASCGKVVYVSLPKYPSTGQIKGFAFVEFQSAEEAEKACKMLNNPPPAKEGYKPGKFPKGNKSLLRLQRIVPEKPEETSNDENLAEDSQDKDESGKKRRKKKGKRKGIADTSVDGDTTTEDVSKKMSEGSEGKEKKKKKKRKKQSLLQQESSAKDEEESLRKDKAQKEISSKEATKVSEEKEDLKAEEEANLKRKKKKKKKKGKKQEESDLSTQSAEPIESKVSQADNAVEKTSLPEPSEKTLTSDPSLEKKNTDDTSSKPSAGRRERKRLRQEDIRSKKREREEQEMAAQKDLNKSEESEKAFTSKLTSDAAGEKGGIGETEHVADKDTEVPVQATKKKSPELTSCLLKKAKPQAVVKKVKRVEFDPIPVTQEFVRGKEARKRKKSKKDKLQLRVIAKKEWLSLKAEYLKRQKSHMTALKESLRELRQQENQASSALSERPGPKHVDLQDVFGTKRLKPTQDVKMAHVEALKFTPNVIVQWKASNEMHRDKIRTMFKDISGDSIAYIDAQEEAKSGYIRFKDEASAEQFAKLSRHSNSFSARVLPVEQQQSYWDQANADRMKKLGRKKQEKGPERIARKVFERNKVTFHEKPSRIKFEDDDNEEEEKSSKDQEKEAKDDAREKKESSSQEAIS